MCIMLILCWFRWRNEAQSGSVSCLRSHSKQQRIKLRSNISKFNAVVFYFSHPYKLEARNLSKCYLWWHTCLLKQFPKWVWYHLFWPIVPRKQKLRQSLCANPLLKDIKMENGMWGMAGGKAAMASWENTTRCSLTWHTSSQAIKDHTTSEKGREKNFSDSSFPFFVSCHLMFIPWGINSLAVLGLLPGFGGQLLEKLELLWILC